MARRNTKHWRPTSATIGSSVGGRPSSSLSGRRLEEAFARRRMAEQERQALWADTSNYFQKCAVSSAKHYAWTHASTAPATPSCEAAEEAREQRKEALGKRRDRLQAMLSEEEAKGSASMAEAARLATDPLASLAALKVRAVTPRSGDGGGGGGDEGGGIVGEFGKGDGGAGDGGGGGGDAAVALHMQRVRSANWELRRREEEKRRREAELLMHMRWRTQHPDIREWERRLAQRDVASVWQVEAEARRREEEERKERQRQERAAAERAAAAARAEAERREAEERARKRHELQKVLDTQLQQLKVEAGRAEQLRAEEAEELRVQAELLRLTEERRAIEKQRSQQHLSQFLGRQCALRLRQRAREVAEATAADEAALTAAAEALGAGAAAAGERRAALRAMVEDTLHRVAEQRATEERRQRELEFLFDEEARRRWQELEGKWKKEQDARDQLVMEVLQTQQKQVQEKLHQNLLEQKAVQEAHAALLAAVEADYAELKEEKEFLNKGKELQKTQLDIQVVQKRAAQIEEEAKELQSKEEEVRRLREEEEKLQKELEKMQLNGYRPASVGRRRMLW